MTPTASRWLGVTLVTVLVTVLARCRTHVLPSGQRISRAALLRLTSVGLGVMSAALWRRRAAAARRVDAPTTGASCVLTPEQTEGPYYIAREKVRANITEHRPGIPLTLRLRVVGASSCAPLAGAAVDIWHCDATGIYSGFGAASAGSNGAGGTGPGGPGGSPPGGNGAPPPGGPGGGPGGGSHPTDTKTFLRGIQSTNAQGIAAFQTIYPGWYRGRTVHIHVKVHLGGSVAHTGQLYFPDSLTDQLYATTAPYKARAAQRDTRNATDGIYQNGGQQSTLTLTRTRTGGYLGTITLGVHQA